MAIFNNTKEKTSSKTPSNRQNIIGYGTSIIGNIVCQGPIRIDGNLEGDIKSDNKVIIGKSGDVKGKIEAKSIDVEGLFDGKVFAEDAIHIRNTAKVKGEVTSRALSIEEGALFNAMSKTTKETLKTIKKNVKAG
ncbi:MAG: bactofilin family protein [Flavobacteriaceae bacterium]